MSICMKYKMSLTCLKLSWSLAHCRTGSISAPCNIKSLTISVCLDDKENRGNVDEIVSAVTPLLLTTFTSAPFFIKTRTILTWLFLRSPIKSWKMPSFVSMPLLISVSITLACPNWVDASYKKENKIDYTLCKISLLQIL